MIQNPVTSLFLFLLLYLFTNQGVHRIQKSSLRKERTNARPPRRPGNQQRDPQPSRADDSQAPEPSAGQQRQSQPQVQHHRASHNRSAARRGRGMFIYELRDEGLYFFTVKSR